MVKKPSTLVLIGNHTVDIFRIHHIGYIYNNRCAQETFFSMAVDVRKSVVKKMRLKKNSDKKIYFCVT